MLERIISITAVGKFVRYAAHRGDTLWRTLTLIYAENGRGKTTLSAIFGSLRTGNSIFVSERATLGSETPQRVELLANGTIARFSDGHWNTTLPDIEVFDDTFVQENVHAGLNVTLGQRRNLNRVIIGARGVNLARKLEELAAAITDVNGRIREREAELRPHIIGQMGVDTFCALDPLTDIDDAIAQKERAIGALRNAEQVRRNAEFEQITMTRVPTEELTVLLGTTLDGITAEAEQHVQQHVAEMSWNARSVSRRWRPICTKKSSKAAKRAQR